MSDLDYTLTSYRCVFCGKVTDQFWYVDKSRGECRCNACLSSGIAETEEEKNKLLSHRFNPSYVQVRSAGKSAEVSFQDTADGRVPLSTVHISAHVEFRRGGNVLKAVKEQWKTDAKNDEERSKISPKRGSINTFSRGSRRRLLQLLNSVDKGAELPLFATVTYPENYPSAEQAKKDLHKLQWRFLRKFKDGCLVWKLEPQKRLAPHFHFEVWNVDVEIFLFWLVNSWHEIAGQGDVNHRKFMLGQLPNSKLCVTRCQNYQHMTRYVSKYIAKLFEADEWCEQWTGRYWGIFNRSKLPLGELVKIETTDKKINEIMRYQRRFANIKKVFSSKSLTNFCNAERWMEQLEVKDNG